MLFSFTWQHHGNRCLQINESKVTCNHPRFSSLDVFTLTVTRKMRNSNLFQKITGTSYETGYLTCKSIRWFITATVLVCPRFRVSTRARLYVYHPKVCVCVCLSMLAQAREWQPVSERCHYLADVCVSCSWGQGHITSSELTLCGQETLLSDFSLEGKHPLQSLMPLLNLI